MRKAIVKVEEYYNTISGFTFNVFYDNGEMDEMVTEYFSDLPSGVQNFIISTLTKEQLMDDKNRPFTRFTNPRQPYWKPMLNSGYHCSNCGAFSPRKMGKCFQCYSKMDIKI